MFYTVSKNNNSIMKLYTNCLYYIIYLSLNEKNEILPHTLSCYRRHIVDLHWCRYIIFCTTDESYTINIRLNDTLRIYISNKNRRMRTKTCTTIGFN